MKINLVDDAALLPVPQCQFGKKRFRGNEKQINTFALGFVLLIVIGVENSRIRRSIQTMILLG